MADVNGRDPAEQEYIDAVASFLKLEQEHRAIDQRLDEAEQRVKAATGPVREVFGGDFLASVTHERTLVRAAVDEHGLADSREGKRAIEAADTMVSVEEAVAAGVSRKEAMMAVVLGQDPRKLIEDMLGQLGQLGSLGGGGPLEF